jgi:hypothetical protein
MFFFSLSRDRGLNGYRELLTVPNISGSKVKISRNEILVAQTENKHYCLCVNNNYFDISENSSTAMKILIFTAKI